VKRLRPFLGQKGEHAKGDHARVTRVKARTPVDDIVNFVEGIISEVDLIGNAKVDTCTVDNRGGTRERSFIIALLHIFLLDSGCIPSYCCIYTA